VKEWTRNAKDSERRFWDLQYGSPEPFTQSFTELYDVVDVGDKRLNHETFTNHLKRMVEEGTLHKYRRDGKRRYEYRLCNKKLIAYLEYFDSFLLRRILERFEAPCCFLSWVNLNNEDIEIETRWTPKGGVPETRTYRFPASAV
jgi:hypothetical protein